jgi:hypothetical protein
VKLGYMLGTPKASGTKVGVDDTLIMVTIRGDGTMGNQQERSLSWLGGIVDGEGTISVQVYTLPDGRVRITPFACIVNSDEGILSESKRILTDMGAVWRFCGHSGTNKNCHIIRMDGEKPMMAFLPAILPYLRSTQKANSAKVVLQYLESRKRNYLRRDSWGQIMRCGYTRAEIELISSIRLAKTAKSSEAICRAPNVFSDEDMVRSNGKPLEAGGTRNDLPAPDLFGWER